MQGTSTSLNCWSCMEWIACCAHFACSGYNLISTISLLKKKSLNTIKFQCRLLYQSSTECSVDSCKKISLDGRPRLHTSTNDLHCSGHSELPGTLPSLQGILDQVPVYSRNWFLVWHRRTHPRLFHSRWFPRDMVHMLFWETTMIKDWSNHCL